jgi:sigma-B regulation protein RsbU (phosphoserine phosphatase)
MLLAEPQLTARDVLRIFHGDEPFLFLGAAFTTIGLLCAALSLLRRRFDRMLLWLAAFAFLYGQRLWLDTGLLGITLAGNGLFADIRWVTNFLVPVPAFLFFEAAGLLPRRGKLYTGILVSLFLGLAVATLIFGRLSILHLINNVLVIAALPFILVRTYLQGAVNRDFVVMRRGLLCFVLLALWDNTMGERWLHRTVEPYGFAVFLGCLGYVTARRTLQRDEELNEIQRELDLARRMQLSLLPAGFPESMAFRVAARYAPMRSVAGDLYEFLVADGRRAGLLIADVSGHGVPAALIASMVKMAALSQREHAEHPGRVLTGMNRALIGSTQGQYVTAAYAHLDADRGEMRYAAAGHPAMLLLREGTVSEVAENGLVLAAVERIEYSEKAVALRPGDRVVLYTDGIVEARNRAGKMFGDESLMEAIRGSAGKSAEEAAADVVERVLAWGASQEDDLTILICDCVGGSSR